MKVKHVLMITAVLLAMLIMPVAADIEIDQGDTDQGGSATVTMTADSSYLVTIPDSITFAKGANIVATDVCISKDAALVVNVTSKNNWKLTVPGTVSSLNYEMKVSGNKLPVSAEKITNGEDVLTVVHPLTSDTATLTFSTKDTAKVAGDHTDTLTFKVRLDTASSINKELVIKDLTELKSFRDLVNDGYTFNGWTVKLAADIDLKDEEWTPIGTSSNKFQGTFDGQGHTISNLYINQKDKSYIGLFGFTTNGEIKNLIVENAKVTGYLGVGVVAGSPYTSTYSDITVQGHVEVNGMAYVGGVGGRNAYADWTDITVNVDESSYVKANSVEGDTAYRTYVGGVVGFVGEGSHKFTNVVSNIDVSGSTIDVGGIVGIAHYGTSYVNCVCTGDVTITNAAEAGDAEEMGGIAGVWHNGGADVTFESCSFTGTLTANINDGLDLTDNTIHGAAYSGTGTGKLVCDCCTQNTEGTGQEEESTP